MADSTNNFSEKRDSRVPTPAWTGAAWIGVSALFLSAICRALRFKSSFPVWEYIYPADYLVTAFFITCLVLLKTRLKAVSTTLWLVASSICTSAMAFSYPWGERMFDGSEAQVQHHSAWSLSSEVLFTFGSTVLLVACVGTIWTNWKGRYVIDNKPAFEKRA